MPRTVTGPALVDLLTGPIEPSLHGQVVAVEGLPTGVDTARRTEALARLATTPYVVVGRAGWSDAGDDARALVDLVVTGDEEWEALLATAEAAPVAATSLALHLRGSDERTVGEGLRAESALYSTLLAGPEFAAWRASTPVRRRPAPPGPVVRVERRGDELHLTLDRPETRNALSVRMRDELLEALAMAEADPALRVVLRGAGPVFCSGGDLDEFGTAPDPATAHLVRLQASVGGVLARLAPRTTAHLHGACYGSGIELPAFAGRVLAAPDTLIALPEVGLGLIPGAGGTISLPGRIGRHRTAWLSLTRLPIDAGTAHAWGLVDEIAASDAGTTV